MDKKDEIEIIEQIFPPYFYPVVIGVAQSYFTPIEVESIASTIWLISTNFIVYAVISNIILYTINKEAKNNGVVISYMHIAGVSMCQYSFFVLGMIIQLFFN